MPRSITEDIDRFAVGLDKLLADIPELGADACDKAVSWASRETAKSLRGEMTEKIGKNEWSEEYRKGFTSRVDRSKDQSVGTVGNKAKPGLVHLLEKGHATLTGRRTNAYPHMEPAFREMEDKFVDRAKKELRKAMK